MSPAEWSKADLHIHSLYSDGANRIDAIIEHVVRNTDLDMIAITDHDTLDGAWQARNLAQKYDLEIIIGEEVTTEHGHVLALFIDELVPAGLSIRETVHAIHEQGGIAVQAHPFDRILPCPGNQRPRPTLGDWLDYGLDALEALNGSQVDPTSNPRAAVWAQMMDVSSTGGSDAHHKEVIGMAHTRFPGSTPEDLKQAILTGQCLPGGHRWTTRNYMGWFVRSFVPRTWRAAWNITPAYSDRVAG